MKGVKLGILGICVSLLGTAMSSNNILAMTGGALGVLLAVIGYFTNK